MLSLDPCCSLHAVRPCHSSCKAARPCHASCMAARPCREIHFKHRSFIEAPHLYSSGAFSKKRCIFFCPISSLESGYLAGEGTGRVVSAAPSARPAYVSSMFSRPALRLPISRCTTSMQFVSSSSYNPPLSASCLTGSDTQPAAACAAPPPCCWARRGSAHGDQQTIVGGGQGCENLTLCYQTIWTAAGCPFPALPSAWSMRQPSNAKPAQD